MVLTKYIVLEKKNEVYLTIDAEDGIRRDIGEYFTFEVPGFKFMPQYRNRVWDGKIRLYNYASKTIYAGLYPYINKWCKDNNIQVGVKMPGSGNKKKIQKLLKLFLEKGESRIPE